LNPRGIEVPTSKLLCRCGFGLSLVRRERWKFTSGLRCTQEDIVSPHKWEENTEDGGLEQTIHEDFRKEGVSNIIGIVLVIEAGSPDAHGLVFLLVEVRQVGKHIGGIVTLGHLNFFVQLG
jgi:hypothetical protein